jgi:hypothetical protein
MELSGQLDCPAALAAGNHLRYLLFEETGCNPEVVVMVKIKTFCLYYESKRQLFGGPVHSQSHGSAIGIATGYRLYYRKVEFESR